MFVAGYKLFIYVLKTGYKLFLKKGHPEIQSIKESKRMM